MLSERERVQERRLAQAQEQLSAVEASFDALLNAAVDGIVVIDHQGRIEVFNTGAEAIFGYSADEVTGRNVRILMPEPYHREHDDYLRNYLETREPKIIGFGRKVEARRKGGTTFPIEISVGEVASHGEPQFVGIIRDVTESQRMEQRLRQREEELRLTIQNAPTPIATADLDGRVLSANLAWCKMLGYSDAEIVNMTFRDFTHPDDIELSEQLLEQAARGERDTYSYEKRYVRKDGHVLQVVLHNGVVRGPDSAPIMLVAQVVDLTERLKAEQEVREHREKLAHVDRLNLMGEMAASIAHEINQPLTVIVNRTSAARRRIEAGNVDPDRLIESLDKVNEQAHRAGEVIRGLRGLVKRRHGERVLADINALVQDCSKLAEVDASLHDAIIDLELAPFLKPTVVDSVQIQQVILNLVRNAIDAIDATGNRDGVVVVRTRSVDADLVEVAVIDNGAGVSEEEATHLFQPFFTTKREGMGMGLSISQSIITAHDGRLWFERNAEGGTTFRFTLPIALGESHE